MICKVDTEVYNSQQDDADRGDRHYNAGAGDGHELLAPAGVSTGIVGEKRISRRGEICGASRIPSVNVERHGPIPDDGIA
jgi:hypothetical protein